jgi:hypothetical protein
LILSDAKKQKRSTNAKVNILLPSKWQRAPDYTALDEGHVAAHRADVLADFGVFQCRLWADDQGTKLFEKFYGVNDISDATWFLEYPLYLRFLNLRATINACYQAHRMPLPRVFLIMSKLEDFMVGGKFPVLVPGEESEEIRRLVEELNGLTSQVMEIARRERKGP